MPALLLGLAIFCEAIEMQEDDLRLIAKALRLLAAIRREAVMGELELKEPTARQIEVAGALTETESEKEAAVQLYIAVSTIRKHVQVLGHTTGLRNSQAIRGFGRAILLQGSVGTIRNGFTG